MSNFCPDTSGQRWSLVWVCLFNGAVGREGRCRQMSSVYVGSIHSVRPHWVCPCSWRTCFPRLHCSGSRLLYRERALSCRHFPGLSRSGSGSRVLHKGADSVGPAFCAFPVRAAQAARRLMSALSSGAARLLPSPSQTRFLGMLVRCALCLFWVADLWLQPSQHMSTIQNLKKSLVRNWKPVCSLVGDAVSYRVCPFPAWQPPPPCLLPLACDGPVRSWLALLCPLFCEWLAVP